MNIPSEKFSSEEALAQGALAAGIRLAASYPGSPGIGVMNALFEYANSTEDLYVEWSVNERVALEMAIGTSMTGHRSLVCVKSVGMNVLLDPLMTLNLTGTHGGLVILLGDDPGAYGSQNEQDTRLLAHLVEVPCLEPATSAEAYKMIRDAFEISERFKTAIIMRITRSFTQQESVVLPISSRRSLPVPNLGLVREPYRFVPYPGNAVELHRQQHKHLDKFRHWSSYSDWDQIKGNGPKGVLAAGFCYQKLIDVIGSDVPDMLRIMKLSTLYPFPKAKLTQYLEGLDEVLVLEETDAFIENRLKDLAYEMGIKAVIFGKSNDYLPIGDELLRWQIQSVLKKFLPDFQPAKNYSVNGEPKERPTKKNHCADSPNEIILKIIRDVAIQLGVEPILIADPGCWVNVAGEIDGKFAIGSAVAVASGIDKVGIDQPIIALFGDSAFFHSAIPAIINAVHNQSKIFCIILNNGGALSTGLQPTPAIEIEGGAKTAPPLRIAEIARACGLATTHLASSASTPEIKDALSAGLQSHEPGLLLIDTL